MPLAANGLMSGPALPFPGAYSIPSGASACAICSVALRAWSGAPVLKA